ncbi:MAG: alpha/beta hydrolase [Lachnospiraceae bacterium]|nr:alpha/beta hydrolase [Lachnospiraceae bacterium]
MSNASDKMRREWSANDAARDAGLQTPDDIVRFDNIQYSTDPKWNILDVYKQKEAKGKMPVIVIVHGGGWVYGTKEIYQFYGMGLAQRGFTVVSYTYRLAPEVKYPAPLEDTNAVVEWMYANSEKYGFDMEHVFMVGDSAGAHLLGLYCAICTDPDYAAHYDFKVPNHFCPKAIGMNCGAYKLYEPDGSLAGGAVDGELMGDFLPENGSAKERALINVIDHVNAKFPPAYIMTAWGDFLKEQAPLLEKAYKKAGVAFESKVYGEEQKPLYHVFHVTMQEPAARECNDAECDFFKKQM